MHVQRRLFSISYHISCSRSSRILKCRSSCRKHSFARSTSDNHADSKERPENCRMHLWVYCKPTMGVLRNVYHWLTAVISLLLIMGVSYRPGNDLWVMNWFMCTSYYNGIGLNWFGSSWIDNVKEKREKANAAVMCMLRNRHSGQLL